MATFELDRVEAGRDPGGPIWVAGEEDVLGQFSGAESDVVLPFSDRECDAVVRVRQDLVPRSTMAFRWRETRPRIVPRSNERQARPRTAAWPRSADAPLGARSGARPGARAGRRDRRGDRREAGGDACREGDAGLARGAAA